MKNVQYELIIIGGGPAGLAAALAAWRGGLRDILIIERDKELGGILNQCVHTGFGLHYFKEELTGPEYAERFIDMIGETSIEIMLDTMVLEMTEDLQIHAVGKTTGYSILSTKSIILSMGCRERTRGAIGTHGSRPVGIFTAGTAQQYCNLDGYMVGRSVVILGSGDIGLIMARRLTLEGAKVLACVEIMPYSGGLTRNIVQCLHDFDIPLYLSHTISEIRGKKRVEKVVISKVDENRNPVPGTEMEIACDTVLLSVGLIPENELTRAAGIDIDGRTGGAVVDENMQTSIPGVFACGNVLHVHDLVDYVSEESERAGQAAAEYVKAAGQALESVKYARIINGDGVSYTVPQQIANTQSEGGTRVFFRANRVFRKSQIIVSCGGEQVAVFKRGHIAPGEMESIVVPHEAHMSEITISCYDEMERPEVAKPTNQSDSGTEAVI